jgi:hypothetical protein
VHVRLCGAVANPGAVLAAGGYGARPHRHRRHRLREDARVRPARSGARARAEEEERCVCLSVCPTWRTCARRRRRRRRRNLSCLRPTSHSRAPDRQTDRQTDRQFRFLPPLPRTFPSASPPLACQQSWRLRNRSTLFAAAGINFPSGIYMQAGRQADTLPWLGCRLQAAARACWCCRPRASSRSR